MNFVHLKATSEFSITHSVNRISDILDKASNDSMGALALTDFNGFFGAIEFYKEARKKGIKPILGVDLTVQREDDSQYQLTVLAKNAEGYKKLIQLNTRAYLENRETENVSIKEEWLESIANGDVVVLSGGKNGLIGKSILEGNKKLALEIAQDMKDYFGDDFYIELQRDGTNDEEKYMDGAVEICVQTGIAPVATHSNYFLNPDDFIAHEARYCIGSKQTLFDIKRTRLYNKDMYFKTQEEMTELFSDIPQALENTIAIAKKCNIELALNEPKLPNFPTPNGETIDDYFTQSAMQGLEERLIENFPDEAERESKRKEYTDRLVFELDVIKKMGFPGYFLIVSDFIKWAKEHDIPVGPGRGSGAGSLVAYSMKITDLDPLPYNLLFERFLNPDRVSMPDFDIDFCQSRRGEVYEYVRQKYGVDAVSQIGTFGTMAARAVIRDVGRTLGYPINKVDDLAKKILIKANNPITLKQFIFGDPDAKTPIEPDQKVLEMYNNEPDIKKLIDIALKLEGITKQLGTHAAGVVIAPTVLTDFTPLYTIDKNSPPATQFNKDDVETSGLVKFDFLGLRNLTIIKEAVDLANTRIEESNKNNGSKKEKIDIRKINISDLDVYKNIFSRGNTIGIFQFESQGMTNVLQKAKPTRLEDLIAITALYRPGPMAIIPEWLASKNLPESQRPYPHEKLREVLSETYGFMIYQEQVMQCAQIIAGYTLGGADLLRRAMGKKKPEEMAKQRAIFIEGAAKNNVDYDKANQLFDLIDKFSGYGFNKSHAAAYAYLSFQTAFLKHYCPEEFFTATLNSHLDPLDTDKVSVLLQDLKTNNDLTMLAPDINNSFYKFNIEDNKTLRYGLGALKGVGEKAILAIVEEREKNGPYNDFYDFLERVGRGHVNKRVMESLVKAGAFDSINPNRAQLFNSIAEGLDYVTKFRKKQLENTPVLNDSIFDDEPVVPKKKPRKKKEVELIKPTLVESSPWDELETLKNEKSSMGVFFSANPYLTYYCRELGGFKAATPICDLPSLYDNGFTDVYIGGLVENIRPWPSKKGAFVEISDGTSTLSIRVYTEFLNDNKEWFKEDAFASLRLKLQMNYNTKEETEELTASIQQGFNFDKTKSLLTSKIFVGSENSPELIEKFRNLCDEYIGSIDDNDPVAILCLPDEKGRKSKKELQIPVKADSKLIEEFIKVFGDEWVKPSFRSDIDNIPFPPIPKKKSANNGKYNNNKNFKKNAFST